MSDLAPIAEECWAIYFKMEPGERQRFQSKVKKENLPVIGQGLPAPILGAFERLHRNGYKLRRGHYFVRPWEIPADWGGVTLHTASGRQVACLWQTPSGKIHVNPEHSPAGSWPKIYRLLGEALGDGNA